MKIREARPNDVEGVRTVHYEAITKLGPSAYDDEQVTAWARGVASADYGAIDADDYHFLVAEDDGDVVGFGSLRFESPEGYEANVEAEVTAVYVHPSVAREGVGSALLAALERRAREAAKPPRNERTATAGSREQAIEGVRTLGLSSSLNAVDFYEEHGYERVRECAHEFSSGEGTGVTGQVVEMAKELPGSTG